MDCLSWPALSLDEWGDRLLAPLEGRRYPLGGSMELTERCNLACAHCFINRPAGDRAAASREMTTAEVKGLVDRLTDAGCLFILFTGGEALLRPDYEEIHRHARQRGMIVSLFSNATLLTPRLAAFLADWRPWGVEVTLYGATRETYEAVTRVPGSFARCREGLDAALDKGLPVSLKAVLMTTNRHELPAMRALADELGVGFRYDALLWPRLDGAEGAGAYRLSLEEMGALDRDDPARQTAWADAARRGDGRLMRSDMVYGCGAGYRSFHVDCAGRLSPCLMTRRLSYDLLGGAFDAGWDLMGEAIATRRQRDVPCRSCAVGELCQQCVGWSQAVHGDDETPVDYVCAVGRQRADQVSSGDARARR